MTEPTRWPLPPYPLLISGSAQLPQKRTDPNLIKLPIKNEKMIEVPHNKRVANFRRENLAKEILLRVALFAFWVTSTGQKKFQYVKAAGLVRSKTFWRDFCFVISKLRLHEGPQHLSLWR
jgi:hypothetical protein